MQLEISFYKGQPSLSTWGLLYIFGMQARSVIIQDNWQRWCPCIRNSGGKTKAIFRQWSTSRRLNRRTTNESFNTLTRKFKGHDLEYPYHILTFLGLFLGIISTSKKWENRHTPSKRSTLFTFRAPVRELLITAAGGLRYGSPDLAAPGLRYELGGKQWCHEESRAPDV